MALSEYCLSLEISSTTTIIYNRFFVVRGRGHPAREAVVTQFVQDALRLSERPAESQLARLFGSRLSSIFCKVILIIKLRNCNLGLLRI